MTFFWLYIIILPLLCFLYRKGDNKKRIPFFILTIVSLVRFDTTADYHNYVKIFLDVSSGIVSSEKQLSEFGYLYLVKLFSFSKWGFIGVFATATLFIYYSFYVYLKRYELFAYAPFVFLCLGCATNFDNIVRQAIAISMFNFAFWFTIQKKKYLAIAFCCLAPIFHTSSYVLIIFFPLLYIFQKQIISRKWMLFLVIISFILYFSNLFNDLRDLFFAISFIANSVYGDYSDIEFDKDHIGLAFIIKAVVCVLPLAIMHKNSSKEVLVCINMSWFSVLLRIAFAGIPFFYRIADYLTLFNVLAISFFIKYYSPSRMVYATFLSLYILLFAHVRSYYGFNSTYHTIFGQNCKDHRYYVRPTFEDVQFGINDLDRKDYYILK